LNATNASRTAMATSLMRAVHARRDPEPLLHDTWGERLVPLPARLALVESALARLPASLQEQSKTAPPDAVLHRILRASTAYADVILRARHTEELLKAAVERGITQYVVIGAGFDSFAQRRPAYARALEVFEVDHPATQGMKRQQLAACGVIASDRLHFVAADLATETLTSALTRSAYQPTQPTFFSWLGVTMYLARDANLATLRAIASCAPPGSELVFSYMDQAVLDTDPAKSPAFDALRRQVASIGEAFQSGFDPRTLSAMLHETGLQLLADEGGDQLLARYDNTGRNGLQAVAAARVAHVRSPSL
jgi:methyltransferase (TIGR00027 family)